MKKDFLRIGGAFLFSFALGIALVVSSAGKAFACTCDPCLCTAHYDVCSECGGGPCVKTTNKRSCAIYNGSFCVGGQECCGSVIRYECD